MSVVVKRRSSAEGEDIDDERRSFPHQSVPKLAAIGILKLETDSIVLSSAYALAKARGRGDNFLRGFGWR